MSDLEKIEKLIGRLRNLKKSINQKNKLSNKILGLESSEVKKRKKMGADLSWACMHIDKEKRAFALEFKDSFLDLSTEEITYKPDGFHEFR